MKIGKLGSALIVVALLAGSLYAFREPVTLFVAKRVAAKLMSSNPIQDLPDGLHIAVCGAGSPLLDEKRGGKGGRNGHGGRYRNNSGEHGYHHADPGKHAGRAHKRSGHHGPT